MGDFEIFIFIFVSRNSTKFFKVILEGEINCITSSHLGQ